jgi:hypothetical protein
MGMEGPGAYIPSEEEVKKAEETMTEKQAIQSEARAEGYAVGRSSIDGKELTTSRVEENKQQVQNESQKEISKEYTPSPEETQKAEETMTNEQKQQSEERAQEYQKIQEEQAIGVQLETLETEIFDVERKIIEAAKDKFQFQDENELTENYINLQKRCLDIMKDASSKDLHPVYNPRVYGLGQVLEGLMMAGFDKTALRIAEELPANRNHEGNAVSYKEMLERNLRESGYLSAK